MKIPKYRKHSSGQARVTLGERTIYLGRYGSKESKQEYQRLVGENIAAGGVLMPNNAVHDLCLAEMFLPYVKWARGHYGPNSTEFDKIKRIVRRTKKTYARTAAVGFGYAQFESIRSSLVDEGVGRKYVNENMDRLVRIFKWAASRGLVPPSVPQALAMIEPLRRGRTVAPESDGVLPVDLAVVEATLPHLPAVVADMVRLQSLIGCRPGERPSPGGRPAG